MTTNLYTAPAHFETINQMEIFPYSHIPNTLTQMQEMLRNDTLENYIAASDRLLGTQLFLLLFCRYFYSIYSLIPYALTWALLVAVSSTCNL